MAPMSLLTLSLLGDKILVKQAGRRASMEQFGSFYFLIFSPNFSKPSLGQADSS